MSTVLSTLSSRAIMGQFYLRLGQATPPAWVAGTAMRVESTQETESYKWLGMTPAMREWIGSREAKGFRVDGIDITSKVFEATLKISVDDLRRDKTGQILTRVNELADRAAAHPTKLLSDLIIGAESGLCYDGKSFFAPDHTTGDSGTQDNDLVYDISDQSTFGTPTAPTPATIQRATLMAVAQIMGFKDDQGEPMNETAAEFVLMVPPPFMGAAMTALTAGMLAQGTNEPQIDNALAKTGIGFRVVPAVNPRLTWTTKMAVFRTDGGVKPFIFQEEQDAKIDSIAEGSELEFKERVHNYGVTRICNVGYGYWQHGCLVTLQA